ncbi:MAG: excinuclease ABC subunit C, partial [Bdellovibrionales bacterium]|nr:excinuclease ABC subunit C [Bdellovibrionales bacterium]
IETLHIRQGHVIGNRSHFLNLNPLDKSEDEREWLVSFINQYYEENIIPDEVLVGSDFGRDLTVLLEKVLESRSEREIRVRYPTDEKGRKLLEMCLDNAKAHFEKELKKNEEKYIGLDELKEKLSLPQRPQRIECYDISTFQGTETVASQVVFEEGIPSKDNYRRYKIKTVQGQNDFASMYEVLSRRFQHTEWEEPQLLVVDGGKGQLAQAVKILEELNKQNIPVVGLAKARTESDFKAANIQQSEERVFIPGRQNPVTFRGNSEGLNILVNIRDEAHRFAITFHRKLREERTLESELDYVVGLGEKRKKILLTQYDSIEDLKVASAEEIARIKGFNRVLAERILLQLNEDEDIEKE